MTSKILLRKILFLIITVGLLAVLALTTNPHEQIVYIFGFFILLTIGIYTLLDMVHFLFKSKVSKKKKRQLWLVSIIVTMLFMLSTAGPLSWVDIGAVLLIGIGWYIYAERRFDAG